ncbi:fumarate reductase flavoprotein subunit [Histoplasma capsulatum var. duboisii H88]|uniref:Fumarate reductase flavoprotein subunit n=1 Tax=Ajellomyces capsulatus (strain H88) TaxID=544711 RepID=A0A8A1LLT1_AJEC8|nr:fumarate reductase flavoprotein subunit [Histoplasma capsulatum var. duboisii H88]
MQQVMARKCSWPLVLMVLIWTRSKFTQLASLILRILTPSGSSWLPKLFVGREVSSSTLMASDSLMSWATEIMCLAKCGKRRRRASGQFALYLTAKLPMSLTSTLATIPAVA